MKAFLAVNLAGLVGHFVQGADDGLALTPPMGWRSWNEFQGEITQDIMEETARAMAQKRDTSGAPSEEGISLLDLGYSDVGLDDNYQVCQGGVGNSFHDASGRPLINKKRFPDMKAMVDTIHSLGFTAGWYLNNCICAEKDASLWEGDKHYEGDVDALFEFGYDSVKLDGCGVFLDLQKWYDILAARGNGKKIMIENCHWGKNAPNETWCPYHMYRSSGDIHNSWDSVWINFQSVKRFTGEVPLSRVGCWAYPDMLEVGRLATFEEDRAHFGAWVITSSPLILGMDARNATVMEKIWEVIANKEAIRINQEWAGHPGRLIAEMDGAGKKKVQVWAKPLKNGEFAALVINDNLPYSDGKMDEVRIPLTKLGAAQGVKYSSMDVWALEENSAWVQGSDFVVHVNGHDSVLVRFSPQDDSSLVQDS